MDQATKPSDLSPEQRDTEALVRRLLGPQVADRYVDFCRLAAGECDLRVSTPMAGHALRELESIVRQTLAVPMDVVYAATPQDIKMVEDARRQLFDLGFTKAKVDSAIDKVLTPRLSHTEQIEAIVQRLGLAPDSDVTRAWKKLTGAHGKAHGRAFYNTLTVDEAFRNEWQVPLDTVMRSLMMALQNRYATLMKRVEDLAKATDRARAAKDFAREIPAALPLLWHFFSRLDSPDWLPHLTQQNLLAAPLSDLEETGSTDSVPLREWPAGQYLKRMAESTDPNARRLVADALRSVGASTHPHVLQSGIDTLAALPADDAAPLANLAETWLYAGGRFIVMAEGAHRLIRNLATSRHVDTALGLTRTLFQISEEDGRLATLFSRHMYEHFPPQAVKALAPVAGTKTVALLCDLLEQAVRASHQVSDDPPHDYSYYHSSEISEHGIKHDVPDALMGGIVEAAKLALLADPACMEALIAAIHGHSPKIFVRIALHILSLNPAAAPDAAHAMLVDEELIRSSWGRKEYAALARAGYPSLDATVQKKILDLVESVPDRIRDGWRQRFIEHEKREPTEEENASFTKNVVHEILWPWRSVLPDEKSQALEALGDPDAWRHRIFEEPPRPPTTPDLAAAPIEDIVSFLTAWKPSATEKRDSAIALAQDLRMAAFNNSARYSAQAEAFAGLPAIYVRNILQGLENAAINKNPLMWDEALKLVRVVLEGEEPRSPPDLEGNDSNWAWSRQAAVGLLAHGLREGAGGFSYAHAADIETLIVAANHAAPRDPDTDDFEERYRKFPNHAAVTTMRGAAIELAFLYLFWRSREAESDIGKSPREALTKLPHIAELLNGELVDVTSRGRIPRAVMGRFLTWLHFFGEDWLRANLKRLFPDDNLVLRDASWLSHLGADRGPVNELAEDLRPCIVTEIGRLGKDPDERDPRHVDDRFAEYLVIFYIAGTLSDDVFEMFWAQAPLRERVHAMWFLGIQLELKASGMPLDSYARAVTYWDRRVAAARSAANPDDYREEIGALGQFFIREGIDAEWLMDQAVNISEAGFAPTDGFSVIDRLEKISTTRPDRAAEVLSILVRNRHFDRWAYLSNKEAIWKIMERGLATRLPAAVTRVELAINHLAAIGETTYLDLLPAAPPEAA